MDFTVREQYTIGDLLSIVHKLRQPGGCPWDIAQTHASIRKNLIEETYEVADAIDTANDALLCEELGDLMLQVVLHVQMAAERGSFTFNDVCDGICKKLIFRHPHVFGNMGNGLTAGQVLHNWEALKNTEKGRATIEARLDSVPRGLPALMRGEKVQKRAAAYGFCYEDVKGAMADLAGEMRELDDALTKGEGVSEEVGDVLFSAVNVARMAGCDAEEALTRSTDKFAARVKTVSRLAAEAGKALGEVDAEALGALWKEAKTREKA